MSTWDIGDLTALGDAEEVAISSYRPDGARRPFVTIWGVRVGDAFYIRRRGDLAARSDRLSGPRAEPDLLAAARMAPSPETATK